MKKILFILFSSVILFSCDPIKTDKSRPPKSEFINSFKKRGIKLSNYLKNADFLVKTYANDTLKYHVEFILDGRKNLITANLDTVFYGKITRSRELFFLHESVPNSHYFVSAIQIEDSIIIGLNTAYEQRYLTDGLIRMGNYPELIIDTNDTYFLLKNDKSLGRELFRRVLNKIQPDSILFLSDEAKSVIIESNNSNQNTKTEHLAIKKIYPNPVQDQLIVEVFESTNLYNYTLRNNSGNVVQQGKLNTTKEVIDCSSLSNGIYFLSIDGKNDKKRIEIKK